MKKFTFFAFISFLFLSLVPSLTISAQYRFPEGSILTKTNTQTTSGERCGTMKWLEEAYRMYPDYRAQYDANQRRMGEYIAQRQREQQSNPNARTTATIVIPVVFHVVMNAAGQNAITDAKVLAQLDTLNHDFGGTNGDSTNIPAAFQAVRGHSNIQFCLAQRTPNDLPTTGIVRVTSSTLSNGNPGGDPVKSTAQGGSDSWDPTKYLNIWLCNFTDPDLLGYATFPPGTAQGAGIPLAQQGVAVLAQTVPGGTAAPYNKGRTLTHEAGHYFWLIHINGDTNCGNDFPGTTSLDDTPQQAALTGGCPSGIIASGCASSPTPPGKMYQNFMDYTDDACMTMFTIGQGTRAESAINLYRPGLLTSNGCVPPPPAAGNDARISAIINPANASSTGCASVIPSVTITNTGSNTLTSATINVRLNGGAPISSAWTGSLAQGASANVTLASLPVILGSNTLKIHTTLPNGLTDANPANDTTTVTFTRIAQSTLPVLNTFETALAPPGWSINNPSGNPLQWFRFNPAGGSAGGSVWAAVCDNYNNPTQDQFSDIISPVISTTGLLANDSILVTFDLAHKFYPEVGVEDSLKVLVSTNCGNTWTTIWERGDPQLATAGSTDLLYNPPAAADWRNLKASIGNNIFGAGAIQVAIRNVNGFGNTMWLDNINVIMKPRKDMEALTINRPNVTECGSSFVPSLTVRNNGGETVTAFKTGYILDNGAPFIQSHNIILAAAGGTTTITFPSLTITPGNHTIRMFTAEPLTVSVGPDGTPANDTLSRTFTVPAVVANLVEGFEGSTFVPAGWFLINPNNDLTWEKLSPGRNSPFAAFIDNWSTNTATRLDHMQTPSINTNGAESL
ncbi:MAG TPA: choice-of-anchor J domain-containing protein, partial [Chitinophagaceae bacterium]